MLQIHAKPYNPLRVRQDGPCEACDHFAKTPKPKGFGGRFSKFTGVQF